MEVEVELVEVVEGVVEVEVEVLVEETTGW